MFADLDEPTLEGVLAYRPQPSLEVMLEELLGATVLGGALPTTLQALTARVARGFDADDCVLVLAEDTTCYSACELSDDALRDLVPLADTVVQLGTTLIARSLPGRPYRAFLGVPVAHEVARRLHAPLDLCLVRKLGVPGQPELAMGAIAAGGIEVLSHELIRQAGITADMVIMAPCSQFVPDFHVNIN